MEDILQRIRNGELPPHAREALVRGMLPLEGELLLSAIFLICTDSPELTDDAQSTFAGLPDGLKIGFFSDRNLEPELSAFYLTGFEMAYDVMSAILLNPMTPGSAIARVAATLDSGLIDLAVNNQVKILEEPEIVDRLEKNPNLSINQKQKLEEYGRLLLKVQISPAEELENISLKEIERQAIEDAKEIVAAVGKETSASLSAQKKAARQQEKAAKEQAKEVEDKAFEEAADDHEVEGRKTKQKISVLEQIATMSVPQKVQAAIKGDREVRSTLIRESNKLVCCAVIKSPRITESEVEFYANLRNVQTDVLRLIAMNREWIKSYKICHNLVKNPRTPLTFSMKLLSRLNKTDLKQLHRDRGVPEALRKMAKRRMQGLN